MKSNTPYRQGDVLLVRIDKVPETAQTVPKKDGLDTLAYGEVTGHHHSIKSKRTCLKSLDDTLFLSVKAGKGPVALVHQEHSPIEIEEGDYRIVIQRQYRRKQIEKVRD